jgi:GAF domain-containing protein
VVEESLSSVDRASGAESEGRHAEFEPTLLALDLSSHSRIISALEASINARALSLDSALDLVAGNAQQLFDASGAAIALPDGGEMVCRASAGRAPEIGVSFRAENGLSGEAVRSGRVVICHDTFRDPRVNSEVWRSVGIRSAISVPIALSKGILGILEVFAAESNAFTSAHGTLLEQLSLLVARIIENPHDRSGDRLLHDVKAK